MRRYLEYSRTDIDWLEDGDIYINEQSIESEKIISITVNGELKVIKAITLGSGIIHYVSEVEEITNCECSKGNKIQRRWEIIGQDGTSKISSRYECEKLYRQNYDNWDYIIGIIDMYIDHRRSFDEFIGKVKILFDEEFKYVTIVGNNTFRWKGDTTTITIKCQPNETK